MCMRVCVRTCIYVYICMCVCICTSMCLYTCVCVCVCILFSGLHNSGPVHMAAAERALAYVRGTHDQGLSYCDPGADNRNILTGWVISDFAADSDTRRSVTGYIMSLKGGPISWGSCSDVTLSSSEGLSRARNGTARLPMTQF